MHIAPRAPDPENMQHSIKKSPIVMRWTRLAPMLGWQKGLYDPPFCITQIATGQRHLQKAALNHYSVDL